MSKIHNIKITNFKNISDLEIDFNGCSAIITAGNNMGKTSFLKGVADRIRFIRPDIMVKRGQKEGKGEMTLDTGERFVWDFDNAGKDKLTYITETGVRQSVTKDLGAQFFPKVFDIDKFLQSSPKEQAKQLQSIVGLDFTDIDKRYEVAYAERTELNRQAEIYRVKLEKMMKADKVEAVDLTELKQKKEDERNRLNTLYTKNKEENEKLRTKWTDEKVKIDFEVKKFNDSQLVNKSRFERAQIALKTLSDLGYKGKDALDFVEGMEKLILPDRNSLTEIQEWAKNNDLQLMIERPAFDGGEIKYELIED